MFTGIVQAVGRIASLAPHGDGARMVVDATNLDTTDVAIGDSIAVSGCCLTVVASDRAQIAFDVSAETLRCTSGFDVGSHVNLEKALRLSDRLGGHLMSGHVDGVGIVVEYAPVGDLSTATSWRLEVEAPRELARYIAPKGSIGVHGVSLTVNGVVGARFNVNLIPHTLDVTTLRSLVPGARVNLEVDLVARYVARLAET